MSKPLPEPPYPLAVYKSGGPHAGPPVDDASTTYKSRTVDDEDEFNAALADGWHRTLPEAVDPKARLKAELARAKKEADDLAAAEALLRKAGKLPAPPAADDRASLLKKAAELGVKVDGRWSDEKLAAAIKEAEG